MRNRASPQSDRVRGSEAASGGPPRPGTGPAAAARILATQRHLLELIATGKPLREILETLVVAVESQCEGTVGSILLMREDDRRLRVAAAPGLPLTYIRATDGLPIGPSAGSCGTAAYRGETVVVEDIDSDPLWSDYREIAREHGLKACWSQPIFSSDRRVLGTLALYYREIRKPGEQDLEDVGIAAYLAGIAIERHRNEQKKRAAERRLLKHKTVLVELAKSEQLAASDLKSFARLATEAAAETLDVERVGIWLFNDERTILRCEDLYELSVDRHSSGAELEAKEFPRYFAALERGRSVVAHDAREDADTSEFAESYLVPLNITSMLDAPVRRAGKLTGVVCHEHVGPARIWAADEQDLAASIGDFVSLVLEASDRRAAQQQFRSAQEELLRQQFQARRQVEFQLDDVKSDLVQQTRLATVGQIAARLAHELRDPLGAIQSAVHYLKHKVPESEPKWAEYLATIEQEIGRADITVGDLLEMSQGKEPWKEPVDLETAVREAFGHVDGRDRFDLRFELDPEKFVVQADPGQLRQVLANLMANSVQAVGGRGTIVVGARSEAGFDCITLSDNGPGIPKELRAQVFEPLVTNREKGTGLGLAVCRQIVERHGGSIELADAVPNGLAVRIRLPG